MNIATDITIAGKHVTVFGQWGRDVNLAPQVKLIAAEDENGDAVDLNIAAEQQAEAALLDEAEKLHALYPGWA